MSWFGPSALDVLRGYEKGRSDFRACSTAERLGGEAKKLVPYPQPSNGWHYDVMTAWYMGWDAERRANPSASAPIPIAYQEVPQS